MCDHLRHLSSSFHELKNPEPPVVTKGTDGYLLIIKGKCPKCGETIQVSADNPDAYTVED